VTRSMRHWGKGSTALHESVMPAPSLPSAASGSARAGTTRLTKRLLDLAVATACLALVSPLLVIVAGLIWLTTPGPALFRQTRLGKDGSPFVLFKFRTMYADSRDDVHREFVRKLLTEDEPPDGGRSGVYKLEHDERITPIGRLIRRTSIDELPQLFNVIRGEMSLVGPRPALPWEAEMLDVIHFARFSVPPGLTGLWQVSGRNTLTMKQGLELDVEYVRRQRLALDLWILLKTIPVVLSTHGAL
jgi:lipopolysaccharide/colanic/teichoic acid biosynthesis glycosyltransferase